VGAAFVTRKEASEGIDGKNSTGEMKKKDVLGRRGRVGPLLRLLHAKLKWGRSGSSQKKNRNANAD